MFYLLLKKSDKCEYAPRFLISFLTGLLLLSLQKIGATSIFFLVNFNRICVYQSKIFAMNISEKKKNT